MQSMSILRDEIAALQRCSRRDALTCGERQEDMEYLKNVIVKYMETREQRDALVPVIGEILAFSPDEFARVRAASSQPQGIMGQVSLPLRENLSINMAKMQNFQDGISSVLKNLTPKK